MKSKDNLLKSTLVYSIGNLGSKVLSFLLVPLYSFFLNKSDLGYYDLLLTSVTLFAPIISLQISEAMYRWLMDVGEDEENQRSRLISTGLLLIISSILITCLLLLVLYPFINVDYKYELVLIIILTIIFQYLQQVARGLKKNKVYSISGVVYTFLLLILNIIFLKILDLKLPGILYSTILAYALVNGYLVIKCNIIKYLSFKSFSKQEGFKMIKYSWPLIPNAVSWWMISLANKYLILGYLGLNENGIFAISNRFPAIILILNSIFMLAWQDHIILNEENKKSFSKFFNLFIKVELSLTIMLVLLSRTTIELLVSKDFYEAWKYMPLLYIGVAVSSLAAFLGTGYVESKNTKSIFYTTIIGGFSNLLFTYLTIDRLGLYAPSIGTLIGFTIITLIRFKQMKQYFGIVLELKESVILLFLLIIDSVIVFKENTWVDLIGIAISLALIVYFNKGLIEPLIKPLKKKTLIN